MDGRADGNQKERLSSLAVFTVSLIVKSFASSVLLSSANPQLRSLGEIRNTALLHARKKRNQKLKNKNDESGKYKTQQTSIYGEYKTHQPLNSLTYCDYECDARKYGLLDPYITSSRL